MPDGGIAASAIGRRRLRAQLLVESALERPVDVVRWMGAVQAQDYPGSLWAIGLRMAKAIERQVEQAVADRSIVRTWPMRGTLHFAAASDVRWLLEHLTPRVRAAHARREEREYALDRAALRQSRRVVERILKDGRPLARPALYEAMERAGVRTEGQRGYHILWWLAQESVICLGPRDGRQPTFVLLDAWVSPSPRRPREDALAELARRYFTSHGPATIPDFAWWSGLTRTEATRAIAAVKEHLDGESHDGMMHWFSPASGPIPSTRTASLLPAWDEYTVAYRHRGAILRPEHAARQTRNENVLSPTLMIGGGIVGTWTRSLAGGTAQITLRPFGKLSEGDRTKLSRAAKRYGAFLQLPVREKVSRTSR